MQDGFSESNACNAGGGGATSTLAAGGDVPSKAVTFWQALPYQDDLLNLSMKCEIWAFVVTFRKLTRTQ